MESSSRQAAPPLGGASRALACAPSPRTQGLQFHGPLATSGGQRAIRGLPCPRDRWPREVEQHKNHNINRFWTRQIGQKTSAILLRLGLGQSWSSEWSARKSTYSNYLHKDFLTRNYLNLVYSKASQTTWNKVAMRARARDKASASRAGARMPSRIQID